MCSATLYSYAKINIGLRILKKRNDGYHDLETIFYPIKLHDEIIVDMQKSDSDYNSVYLKSNIPFMPLSKDNLCYKAIEYFFKEFRIKECYRISLNIIKHIPVGGGLGGGSSNAAAILKFLIRYLNINVESNREKILNLALAIGSDVPFFLTLKPCFAGGRGEKMTMLRDFNKDYSILIVNPNLHISTKWAFEKLNFKKEYESEPLISGITKIGPDNLKLFVNDFENVVFAKYGELKTIKEDLLKMGAVFSSMSGTGATMYGLFEKNKKGTLRKCRDYYHAKKYFTYISD